MPQFDRRPIPESLMREVAQEIVDREREQFQRKARRHGWVPLAEVLDALDDEVTVAEWAEKHGTRWVNPVVRSCVRQYLADRFPTAPQGADERNDRG